MTMQTLGLLAPGPTLPVSSYTLSSAPRLPPSPLAPRFPSLQGKRSNRLAVCFYFCTFRFLAPRLASR